MKETGVKMVGVGLPIIDRIGAISSIPVSRSKVDLLRASKNLEPNFGGVIPNILSTYVTLSHERNGARIIGAVGEDNDGHSFQKSLSDKLGPLQTNSSQETATLFDLDCPNETRVWELFLGAAAYLEITDENRREMETLGSFYYLTDINTLRVGELKEVVSEMFGTTQAQDGCFLLNLAGSQFLSDSRIDELADCIPIPATVIVGNEQEFEIFERTSMRAITQPQTLKIVTLANNGSLVLHDGHEICIPSDAVLESQYVNNIGCGDSYMGVFLSVLLSEKPEYWDEKLLIEAGYFASFIASQTARTKRHRLTPKFLRRLKTIYDSANNKH